MLALLTFVSAWTFLPSRYATEAVPVWRFAAAALFLWFLLPATGHLLVLRGRGWAGWLVALPCALSLLAVLPGWMLAFTSLGLAIVPWTVFLVVNVWAGIEAAR